jgi:hypothetical protein
MNAGPATATPPSSPTAVQSAAELARRRARSQEILAGIQAKIKRLEHAKAVRQQALVSLNAATSRGLDENERTN